jgi:hypothetical protein
MCNPSGTRVRDASNSCVPRCLAYRRVFHFRAMHRRVCTQRILYHAILERRVIHDGLHSDVGNKALAPRGSGKRR